MSLVSGSVQRAMSHTPDAPAKGIVLQIKGMKNIVDGQGKATERYRLTLTDGSAEVMAMLSGKANSLLIQEGRVVETALVELQEFTVQVINGNNILLLSTVNPVGFGSALVPDTKAFANPAPVQNQNMPQNNYNQASAAPYAGSTSNAYAGAGYGQSSISSQSKPIIKHDDANVNITPISQINPYSNKWTIKARITSKSEVRKWNNAKGTGTLFSIDLLDNSGGEIRGTFFKEACDKYYPLLEQGSVYTFSGGQLKVVQNKQYSTLKNNYEITFDQRSEIKQATDDNQIKASLFDFVKISDLQLKDPNAVVDILGVVKASTEPSTIISQKLGGKELQRRELTVVDDSNAEVRVTLWGEKALSNDYNWHTCPVVAIKGVKVSDYGGRSLGTMNSSQISINPSIPEGELMHRFKIALESGNTGPIASMSSGGYGGGSSALEPLASRKTIASIKDEAMGLKERADELTLKACIKYIKKDNTPYYTACPTCNKKVTEAMSGWVCEKCNMSIAEPNYRYVMACEVMDHTGSTWISMFDEAAAAALGVSAKELSQYKRVSIPAQSLSSAHIHTTYTHHPLLSHSTPTSHLTLIQPIYLHLPMQDGDDASFEKVLSEAHFRSFFVQCRVKQESYNDGERVKTTVKQLHQVNFVSECNMMLDAIAKYA